MKKIDWNDGWKFTDLESGETKTVNLPHDAMLEKGRGKGESSGAGGAFFKGGKYRYEKEIITTADDVSLYIEGVMPKAQVYVNDVPKETCVYGYNGYCVSLPEGENHIRIEVDDSSHPSSRWYAGAGLYRPVWLCEGSLFPSDIHVTTVSIDPVQVRVDVNTEEKITLEILDGDYVLYTGHQNHALIQPDHAELWSAENPNLYTCRIRVDSTGEETAVKFGVRLLSWSKEGFFVNGKKTLLKGACVHHDNGILGAVTMKESEFRRIARLKSFGFNAIRSSHNPAGEYVLEACDTLGMYVMDETWDMWYSPKNPYDYASEWKSRYEEDIQKIVEKDYNHPSVIMYSFGNELTEPKDEAGLWYAEKIVNLFHELDHTRPVTAGINITLLYLASMGINLTASGSGEKQAEEKTMNSTDYNEMVFGGGEKMNRAAASDDADRVSSPVLDLLDIAGYNYASSRYDMEGEKHPDRVIVGSETYPYKLAENWEKVEAHPYLIGDFMWTGWDYLGEVGIGAWTWEEDGTSFHKDYPWLLSDAGALDILGNDNAEAGLAKSVFEKSPVPYIGVVPCIHPKEQMAKAMWRGSNAIPSWSWKGCEGKPAQVEVYAYGYEAELYLNDQLIGRKQLEGCRADFELTYEPGILKAVVHDEKRNVIGESTLTSSDKVKPVIHVEEKLTDDDVYYVDINIEDENGIVESAEDKTLSVTVENGQLLGFGSARPRSSEDFTSGTYTTYYGRSLAVVKAESDDFAVKAEVE